MTDKKTFAAFIKLKRTEKNLSQKELAEKLFVTESAISKWERGITYPDITLISDICNILDISEHEFITASTDTTARTFEHEAKSFRIIRTIWFLVPTISYIVTLLTCFICNLAVNHTLSWFFIVLSALICAYSFIPTFSIVFKTNKLLIFTLTSYLSICLLLLTCGIYTNSLFWVPVACIGTLMGYIQLFIPMLLAKTKISRYKFIISFTLTFILTVLILIIVNAWQPFMLKSAIMIALYAYLPVIICTYLCSFKFDAFLKTSFCIFICSIAYCFMGHLVNTLFNLNESYEVNLNDWQQCLNGNILFICISSFLFIGIVFFVTGILRSCKKKGK